MGNSILTKNSLECDFALLLKYFYMVFQTLFMNYAAAA